MPPPPGETEADIGAIPTGPSVSLQLNQAFGVFRTQMLTDMKSLLQAALQEVLDQHEVLIRNQEHNINEVLQSTLSQVREQVAAQPAPMAVQPYATSFVDMEKTWSSDGAMSNDQGGGANMPPSASLDTSEQEANFQPTGSAASFQTSPSKPKGRVRRNSLVKGATPEQIALATGAAQERINGGEQPVFPINVTSAGQSNQFVLFGDNKILQDKTAIDEQAYDVRNFYKTTGFVQWVARSEPFNVVTLCVICANALYLGIDADRNDASSIDKADAVFQVCENLFCIFFFVEIIVRFEAFAAKRDCLKDAWFKFDLVLVVLMVLETWVFPSLVQIFGIDTSGLRAGPIRLVRLLRLTRLTRILRALPELCTMVKGMYIALRAVMSALLMLVLLVYVFAILMHSFLKDDRTVCMTPDASMWCTVSESMWTLLVNGVFLDDLGIVVRHLADSGEALALCFFLVFILMSATTVMNMLIGVLCEVVCEVASAEKEQKARSYVRGTLLKMLKELDTDGSGDISKQELVAVVTNPAAMATLMEIEVDIPHFLEMQDMYFDGPDTVLSISQIMYMILDNRGGRQATVADLVQAQSFNRFVFEKQLAKQTEFLRNSMEQLHWRLANQSWAGWNEGAQLEVAPSNKILDKLQTWMSKGSA